MSFRIESNGLGVAWQLGSPRIDIRPDGRRWSKSLIYIRKYI
jgi:hypothetical protein